MEKMIKLSKIRPVGACCSVLQCVAVQRVAVRREPNYLKYDLRDCVMACGSVLQCVAVCCSALRCVAVRCSVL